MSMNIKHQAHCCERERLKEHVHLTCDIFSFFFFLLSLSGTANVCRNGPAFEIQSVKVKHTLWPRSVAGSPRGGVTSAIDPDFKKE